MSKLMDIVSGETNIFTIKTDGCVIPGLNPSDETIKELIKYPHELKNCSREYYMQLVDSNNTHIWVQEENFPFYYIWNERDFHCCYRHFTFEILNSYERSLEDSECYLFKKIINVSHEFVYTDCFYLDKKIYENFFLFAPKKSGFPDNSKLSKSYNVLIIGLESISRINFQRTMPKTVQFLKSKGAIDLHGYNKIGDNSLPNLLPLLAGKSLEEASNCVRNNIWINDYNCSFLWNKYQNASFITALAADSDAGVFELYFNFEKPPTTYYLYPFIELSTKYIANYKILNYFICMGNKFYYKVLLDYMKKLTINLEREKLFGFFWQESLSHDLINSPMIMDNDYVEFLKEFDRNGYLDKSIVILLSDHGFRWGQITLTAQGHIEERLPFVYFLIPHNFRARYKKAVQYLETNAAARLTTAYDVHETLLHLLDETQLQDHAIDIKLNTDFTKQRGISLFLPIPSNRTCSVAGIGDHWCTCHKGRIMPAKHKYGQEAAKQLVSHINRLLNRYPQCTQLRVQNIYSATYVKDKRARGVTYSVTISTTPGGGIFDASLRRERRSWAVLGTVSRLNLYKQQSKCIDNRYLKMYCYCE